MRIEFLFDYISPYSYLAWSQLPRLKKEIPDLQIKFTPILFAGLLNHWGHKGPAEIPPKRAYIFTQCLRYAKRNSIPFTLPKFHPFNPVTSLRLSLNEVASELQLPMMSALWRAGWQQARDLGDANELAQILQENNLPLELLEKTQQIEIKNILKTNTIQAIAKGVFGVPTFLTEDTTLFWGLDSLADLKTYLVGEDNVNKQEIAELLNRESSATR